jgi:serine/threonine protein phosphatase PrpC
MAANFAKIDLRFMVGIRERSLRNATWQGPLRKLAVNILKPIATGQVAVAADVKREAVKLMGELNKRLLALPAERPAAAPKAEKIMPWLEQASLAKAVLLKRGEAGEINGSSLDASAGAVSVIGGREHNEDAVLIGRPERNPEQLVLLVGDGMGGYGGGDIASGLLAEASAYELTLWNKFGFNSALQMAHGLIIKEKQAGNLPQFAGTTATIAVIEGDKATIQTIADSPYFLVRNGQIVATNVDWNKTNAIPMALGIDESIFPAGDVSREAGADGAFLIVEPNSKNLVRFWNPRPTETVLELQEGDLLILSSDGLSNYLGATPAESAARFLSVIDQFGGNEPLEIARALQHAVVNGKDNISVIAYQHGSRQVSDSMIIDSGEPASAPVPAAPAPAPVAVSDPLLQAKQALLTIAPQAKKRADEAAANLDHQQKIFLGLQQEKGLRIDNLDLQITHARERAEEQIFTLKQELKVALDQRRAVAVGQLRQIWDEIDSSILAKRLSNLENEDPELISIRSTYQAKISAVTQEAEGTIARLTGLQQPAQQALRSLTQEIAAQNETIRVANALFEAEQLNLAEFAKLRDQLPKLQKALEIYTAKVAELAGQVSLTETVVPPPPAPTPRPKPVEVDQEEVTAVMKIKSTGWKDTAVAAIIDNRALTVAEKASKLAGLVAQGNKEAADALKLPEFNI